MPIFYNNMGVDFFVHPLLFVPKCFEFQFV